MAWIANVVKRVVAVGTAGAQVGMASEELKHLPDYREYSLNQDLATATALARKGSQQGMTPEERAVAGQAIGTKQSRTQRAMEQRGLGSLAAAITQSNATDAFNKLEAQNQEIKRGYLTTYGQLGSKVQALENANVTSFNQQLALQQRELGMAVQQGYANLFGAASPGMENIQKFTDVFKKNAAQREAEKEMEKAAELAEQANMDAAGLGAPKTQLGDQSQFTQSLGTDDFQPMTTQEALDSSQNLSIGGGVGNIDPDTGFSTSSIGGIGANMGQTGTMNMDVGTTDYNMDFQSMGGTTTTSDTGTQ